VSAFLLVFERAKVQLIPEITGDNIKDSQPLSIEDNSYINGLKSVGIIWGEATSLCRRIKIRWYGMGEAGVFLSMD
jgi:hypothetical protein